MQNKEGKDSILLHHRNDYRVESIQESWKSELVYGLLSECVVCMCLEDRWHQCLLTYSTEMEPRPIPRDGTSEPRPCLEARKPQKFKARSLHFQGKCSYPLSSYHTAWFLTVFATHEFWLPHHMMSGKSFPPVLYLVVAVSHQRCRRKWLPLLRKLFLCYSLITRC